MTKVIIGEFKKLEDLNDEDISLTCGTSLEVFNKEFNQMSRKDDDSEQRVSHEADDDMDMIHLMLHLLNEDDEVELTDEEFSDNEDEIAETYEEYKDDWIYEWNRDVPWVDEKPWTDIGVWTEPTSVTHYFGNSLHYQDYEWYEALKDSELKEQALRNKAIMEGLISDDESSNDGWRR
ncbi:hypothetical protein Tco_1553783 [Tanacetum coccineum]